MDSPPADTYDYGNSITYQGDQVYYGSQPVASTGEYYQQANNLANNSSPPADDSQWMPLGVFAVLEGDSKTPSMTFQLAVNKQGVIRGNATKSGSDSSQLIQGSVDRTRSARPGRSDPTSGRCMTPASTT
jgi:hypothetical protein